MLASQPVVMLVFFLLQIFTVDKSYKVELQFTKPVGEVEKNQDEIKKYVFVRLLSGFSSRLN